MGAQPLVSAQVSSAPAALADVHIYRWLGAAASNWAAIVAAFVAVAIGAVLTAGSSTTDAGTICGFGRGRSGSGAAATAAGGG